MYNDKLCQGIYYGNGEQFSNAIELEKEYAIKEFAEKLKEKAYSNNYCQEVILKSEIDRLLKEYEK